MSDTPVLASQAPSTTTPTTPKDGRQLFKPGQSGNPSGKPKGTKNKSTIIRQAIELGLVETLEKDAQAILLKTIELAKAGDVTCIKILLDKLLPTARSDSMEVRQTSGGVNIIIKSASDVSTNTPADVIEGEVE